MFAIVFAAAMGLSAAATATVARRIGEKDPRAASHAGAQSIILGVITALAFAIPGAIYGGDLLAWMSGSESLKTYGASYTKIMLAGTPGVMLLFLNNAIFRGAGNATTTDSSGYNLDLSKSGTPTYSSDVSPSAATHTGSTLSMKYGSSFLKLTNDTVVPAKPAREIFTISSATNAGVPTSG